MKKQSSTGRRGR
jgi:hypothetical protein